MSERKYKLLQTAHTLRSGSWNATIKTESEWRTIARKHAEDLRDALNEYLAAIP